MNLAQLTSRTRRVHACVVVAAIAVFCGASTGWAAVNQVRVQEDRGDLRLQVDGKDFMVLGMNWDYFPIGTNYTYDLWTKTDEFIREVLSREMPLLTSMGVNTIRSYVGMPPRWIQYIYETYGIYTVINHPMARYGFTLNGTWIPSVDYSDPKLRSAVKAEILAMVEDYRQTPGLLMWLLGNENNYALSWRSAETQALPEGERNAARARHLYSLFDDITRGIQALDSNHPVAIANGDLQYIDIIAEECKTLDILGSNVYRGISARDLFQVVHDKLGVPTMFTEFGADAWNAREMREDQVTQARYLIGQWQEIYEQSSGKGRVGNAIGGFIFQWTDGWWKFGLESRLDVHDTNASWPNGGYAEDFMPGENNMNEEWWGIVAKGPTDSRGLYAVYPRAAYYALREALQLDPFSPDTDLNAIRAHFQRIDPTVAALVARGDNASYVADTQSRVRMSNLRMHFETYSTGGAQISTPPAEDPQESFPSFLGFDHLQSFWADFQVKPAENVTGNVSLSILGHVPVNPINEIFYENRGRQQTLLKEDGTIQRLEGIERVKVYRADVSWDDRWFRMDGFYRSGHTHWGYEGDFFGLYRDAYYGENIDIYNGEAPLGVEMIGKKSLSGLKVAFGPELHWGANPMMLFKYQRTFAGITATGMYQDEFAKQNTITSTIAIPVPPTKRATLSLERDLGPFGVQVGGIWAGSTKKGELFQIADETSSGTKLLEDTVREADAFGAKGKVTWERGRWHWYAQGAYAGIVADGGPTAVITYTGWTLKDTGLGNGTNLLTGLAVNQGSWQFAPNFLWQKPLVGPIPGNLPSPARPRNVRDDPFAVRYNRETVAGEFLLIYDPTPATWMWAWDNIVREDARFAGSIGYVFRHLPTTQDASLGISAEGDVFAFPGAPPARDLWELRGRMVSRLSANTRMTGSLYTGTGEPNGDDARLIRYFGGDARIASGPIVLEAFAKFDEWGPYDYHRDFNQTFPVQLMGDISYALGKPRWFGFPQTRFGVRGTWRSLDQNSPRYCTGKIPDLPGTEVCDPSIPGPQGREWEIRTYLHVSL